MGEWRAESTLENALSAHKPFRLSEVQAKAAVREVANVVDNWRQHFESLGVSARDIEMLSASIDRPFPMEQRLWTQQSLRQPKSPPLLRRPQWPTMKISDESEICTSEWW